VTGTWCPPCARDVTSPSTTASAHVPSHVHVHHREKNFEKAQKEAKAKARKEAARHAELADNVTDEDLAAVEDTFARETGIISSSGDDSWRLLEARRAAVEAAAVAAAAVAAHADAQDALGGGRDSGCGAALMSSSRASVAVGGAAGDGG
jgi:hypothetical protein